MEQHRSRCTRTRIQSSTNSDARSGTRLSSKVSKSVNVGELKKLTRVSCFIAALTDYGPRIEEFTDALLARLDKVTGTEVVVNEFCLHYVYDVMSGVGFGSATRFIEGESSDFANTLLTKIQQGIVAIAFLAHVPWMLTVAESLVFVIGGPMKLFQVWSAEQVKKRRLVSRR